MNFILSTTIVRGAACYAPPAYFPRRLMISFLDCVPNISVADTFQGTSVVPVCQRLSTVTVIDCQMICEAVMTLLAFGFEEVAK